MRRGNRCLFLLGSIATMIAMAGCDRAVDTSRAAKQVTEHAIEDAKSSWRDFFSYHPAMPDPLPQTRYCYQMQSDVVCYDSEQTKLTAKLVGYQDGENISWVQPGGGSLGASGGGPVALRPVPQRVMATANMSTTSESSSSFWSFDKFLNGMRQVGNRISAATVESTKGQISVKNLDARNLGSSSANASKRR